MGLILTAVLLFAFQAQTIIANPLIILLIAIPLLAQTYGIFTLKQSNLYQNLPNLCIAFHITLSFRHFIKSKNFVNFRL
ncbi:hypothetical protein GVX76_02500 [[Haemophilus] felis]|nr:hypothetical protein [[Haemophilus] felis]